MVQKRIKATKPNEKTKTMHVPTEAELKDADKQIAAIIEKGRKKGFLTYEEMNDDLPEAAATPARLDSLLATLDEMGVTIIDEADVEKHPEEFDGRKKDLGGEDLDEEQQLKEDQILEKQLIGSEGTRRIDDPIRMYLTQMGEIPLLARHEEISLAKKIELARMAFRRKMLENEYCAQSAMDVLQQVYDGTLSFDRTMKISTVENLIRTVIKKRLPVNLGTANKLLQINRYLFKKYMQIKNADTRKKLMKHTHRNKRKIATLLEELSLRTSRVQPMQNRLNSI